MIEIHLSCGTKNLRGKSSENPEVIVEQLCREKINN